jgi:hypothetical protein
MMIFVAVVALGLAALRGLASIVEEFRLDGLSAEYRRRAEWYAAPRYPSYWKKNRGHMPWDRQSSPIGKPWETLSSRERWFVEMANKYRQAAKQPWVPLAPDSPEPPPE